METANTGVKSEKEANVVFIGHKPTMVYVLSVVTQANENFDEILIKARGRNISEAVDVAEIVTKKHLKSTYKIEKMFSDTEEKEDTNKIIRRISVLTIVLKRI